MGYDVHRLVEGRKLIIGGVEIPHTLGLLGHSDADVLLHAVADALLGAAALGDIGRHFPDTDPKFKGADSMKLLAHVAELIKEKGGETETVDIALKLPYNMDGIIVNIPGYMAGLPEEAWMTEFVSVPTEAEMQDEEIPTEEEDVLAGAEF
jgi:hypothetical protein